MRNVISLNKNWAFIQENAGLPGEMPTDWHKVDLPHTWNAVDGHDGNGSYDRGKFHPVFGVCIVWIEWKCVDKSY